MKHKNWSLPTRIEKSFEQQLFQYLTAPDPDFAERIARNMATAVRVGTQAGWRKAAAESTKSRMIHSLLRNELSGPVGKEVDRLIVRNALLIRTLPLSLKHKASTWIAEQQRKGRRSEALQEELEAKFKQLTAYEVRRIARTETAKSAEAITQCRAQAIGINAYQWLTSEDGRVRKSHKLMDKVLVFYNDPPNPEQLAGVKSDSGHYHAGNIWNCRCTSAPIVSLDEISWPARVYTGGRITRMTRAQFQRIANAA